MIAIYSLAVFAFCTWAVFSHKFDDGLIVKHLLIFSAISSFLTILDAYNIAAAITAGCCLFAGMAVWVVQHRALLFHRR